MSCVYLGQVIDTRESVNARGGTEMMRERLVNHVDPDLLSQVAIHFSRVDKFYPGVPNIYYAHDLPGDASLIRAEGEFDGRVYVSEYQKKLYGLPGTVIPNAISKAFPRIKGPRVTGDPVRMIYHTTPHRGLSLAVPIVDQLVSDGFDVHFDVYSSFSVYGWDESDVHFANLFDRIRSHPNMTYHGGVHNSEVLEALRSSDIFLYPSIWEETSCIALIEACSHGVIPVIPETGVFTETVFGDHVFFPPDTDYNQHANNCYQVLKRYLETGEGLRFKKNPGVHTISNFRTSWNHYLEEIIEKWNQKKNQKAM